MTASGLARSKSLGSNFTCSAFIVSGICHEYPAKAQVVNANKIVVSVAMVAFLVFPFFKFKPFTSYRSLHSSMKISFSESGFYS